MHMDLNRLVPVPAFKTPCRFGLGLAVCPTLGVLVTSQYDDDTLSVLALPSAPLAAACASTGAGLALVCTLGGASSHAPMRFQFLAEGFPSGRMAFTKFTGPTAPATSRLLLLTDAGHDAVHVIDVAGRVHAGYVAAPGTIARPRGVAARGSLAAVSTWSRDGAGDHVVRIFEGSGARWTATRELAGGFGGPGDADGQLSRPNGLRLSADGTGLVVADPGNSRVSQFHVEDGSFVRHVATGLRGPWDVEECESGWLVVCMSSHCIESVNRSVDSVGSGGLSTLGGLRSGEFRCPIALALVPGLGLVVREFGSGGRLQLFATPEVIAMASMSPHRLAWMAAVARGVLSRAVLR
jgi:hypothetical protein